MYILGIQGSPRKLDGSKVVSSPGGEGVLANFFNSLLYKKTGSQSGGMPKSPGGENLPDKATMRTDAAAELDRLARGGTKKPSPPASGSGEGGTVPGSSNTSGVDFNASDC